MDEKKKSRFVIDEGDIKIGPKREPTEEEKKEADETFGKILKDKKPEK